MSKQASKAKRGQTPKRSKSQRVLYTSAHKKNQQSTGNSPSLVTSKVKDVRKKLEEYNDLLTTVDAAVNELERAEKALKRLSVKVLPEVATRYDKESDRYEMVGGVKPSERKRTKRQHVSAVTV